MVMKSSSGARPRFYGGGEPWALDGELTGRSVSGGGVLEVNRWSWPERGRVGSTAGGTRMATVPPRSFTGTPVAVVLFVCPKQNAAFVGRVRSS